MEYTGIIPDIGRRLGVPNAIGWTAAVSPTLGAPVALANFAPVPNTVPGLGPPVSEAVPASIREVGNDYFVSLLSGFPFGPGAASVWRVNRFTGATERVQLRHRLLDILDRPLAS